MEDSLSPSLQEIADIEALGKETNPLARVIYHMANRQLTMSERLIVTQSEMLLLSGAVRRIQQKQAAIIDALEERGIRIHVKESSPNLSIAALVGDLK